MEKLSAVRAFVGGESLWSKAQKDAVFSLQRYAATKDEKDYQAFLKYLEVSAGDRQARLELLKPNPNLEIVRQGFLKGKIHPDDIDPMVDLLLRFYWVDHIDRALTVWTEADLLLVELTTAAKNYRSAVDAGKVGTEAIFMDRLKELNEALTVLEEEISYVLGEGSRYLENVVFALLTILVIMVEAIGLSLVYFTSRSITRGLGELNFAANEIGHGRLDTVVIPHRNDEIGELAEGLNQMGAMLKKSYGELEQRVQERTTELAKLAAENKDLYHETNKALLLRDQFLSLASHELKTPITSMLLQAQLIQQRPNLQPDDIKKFSAFLQRQLLRINGLVEEMLDTSRVDLSKLSLKIVNMNLSALLIELTSRFEPQLAQANIELKTSIEEGIVGPFDSYRIEQVINNLLNNTIKYAPGKPVEVELMRDKDTAILTVRDHGTGIAAEDRERIFGRFERSVDSTRVSGLGIGLFIARAIVTAHNGLIFVDPKVEDGTKFVVELPLARKNEAEAG